MSKASNEQLFGKYWFEYQAGMAAYRQGYKATNPFLGQGIDIDKGIAWDNGVRDARGPWYKAAGRWLFFNGVPIVVTGGFILYLNLSESLGALLRFLLEISYFLTLNTGVMIGLLLFSAILLAPAYGAWYCVLRLFRIRFRTWY